MKSFRHFMWTVFFVFPFISGCLTSAKTSPQESAADTALTPSGIPAAPPTTDLGEPQKGFQQEFEKAQNP